MKKNLLVLLSLVTLLLISSLAISQERRGEKITVSKSAVVEFSTIEVYSRKHPADPKEKRIGGIIAGQGEEDEEGEMPKMKIPKYAKVTIDPFGKMPMPTMQKPSPGTNSQNSFSPIIDFNGIDDINSSIPPDVGGQVGPNHVMTTLNSFVRVSSRTGTVISTVTLNAFFSSVGAPSTFDPKVLYDPYNNRWIITACGNAQSASSALLIGVSQTNDPTGAWNLYSIDVDAANTNWFDYHSIGFNKNWVVIGGNMFTNSANTFTSGKIYVFKKSDLYAALPSPAVTVINAGSNGFTLVPAVTYDNSISTMYLTQNFNGNSGGNGFIGFYTITGAVGSEVLSSTTFVSTPNPWNDGASVTNFAPQLGTTSKVACNDSRMQKTIYRNGSIWCTHSVFLPIGTPTRSAVQWWQLNTGAGIVQRGRIDDPTATNFYAFPSIDVNKNDDAMIGCAKFNANIFPSATYALRMASDPINTFQSDFVYKAGLAKYFKTFGGSSNRWGDYTSVAVDPVNDLNFWTVQEYALPPSNGNDLWGTWWAGVSIPVSTPDIRFDLSSDAQSETTISTTDCRGYKDYTYKLLIANTPTGTATVTLTVANGGTATQNVDYQILNTILTFPDGSNALQPFTIRIYDDAAKENIETFTLNYTISGTTNAQAGTFNQVFTFTIADNDAVPIASANLSGTIGTANANYNMPFRGAHFDARTQMLYSATELSALGFSAGNITSVGFNVTSKGSTQPFNGFTIRLKNTATPALSFGAFETGGTQVFNANYSTVAGQNTIPITPFAWDGISNLLVDICFDNTTSTANDFVAGTTANPNCLFDRQSTNATPGCSIVNSVFSLNPSGRPLITLAISLSGSPVSTALNNTKTAYLGPNDDIYFYDGAGAIMARIKNNTAFDYGCTEVTIDRAGTGAAQFWNSNTPDYLASKTIKVVPTNNTSSGNYDISIYYTGNEVSGFETAATPTTFNSSKVVKVSNGFFVPDVTAATPHPNDVKIVSGTATTFGADKVMTGNFISTGFSGFGVGVPGCPSAPFTSDTTVSICNTFIWNGTTYKASGDYLYNTTTAAGCDSIANLHLTILSVTSTHTKTDAFCNGSSTGSITVTPTFGVSPFTYRIGTVGSYVSTNTFNNLKAGNYRISILDVNGCAGISSQVTIGQQPALTASISKIDPTCYGGSNGNITVTPTNGASPYLYRLGTSGSYVTNNSFAVRVGTYRLYEQDAAGCTNNFAVVVSQPSAVGATFTKVDETCPLSKDGSIIVNGTGGATPYQYRFGTTGTYAANNNSTGLKAGTYRVYVRDANGCGGISIGVTINQTFPSCVSTFANSGSEFRPQPDGALEVTLSPNPTKNQFMLTAHSKSKQPVTIRITDAIGKINYENKGLPEQPFRFGEKFANGLYLIEVRQGDKVKTVKAVKGR